MAAENLAEAINKGQCTLKRNNKNAIEDYYFVKIICALKIVQHFKLSLVYDTHDYDIVYYVLLIYLYVTSLNFRNTFACATNCSMYVLNVILYFFASTVLY